MLPDNHAHPGARRTRHRASDVGDPGSVAPVPLTVVGAGPSLPRDPRQRDFAETVDGGRNRVDLVRSPSPRDIWCWHSFD